MKQPFPASYLLPTFTSMKKHLALLLLCISGIVSASAQNYITHPKLPAFFILSPDSSKVFNTYYIEEGKPTVFIFFSPDCDHCQKFTKQLLPHMAEMKDANFYFLTIMDLPMLRAFSNVLGLQKYPNISTGKDYQLFFPTFYHVDEVPCIVVYDKHRNFQKFYKGVAPIDELVKLVQQP